MLALAPVSAIYDLKYPCRTMAPVLAEDEMHSFFVGTMMMGKKNEIHQIEFDEDRNMIKCLKVLKHPAEIGQLSPCPHDANLLFTVFREGFETAGSLWQITDATSGTGAAELEQIFRFPDDKRAGNIMKALWEPSLTASGSDCKVLGFHEYGLQLCSIEDTDVQTAKDNATGVQWAPTEGRLTAAAWSQNKNQVSASVGRDLVTWDLRTFKQSTRFKDAHPLSIRDIDYNPNKPWYLVSGSDDGSIKFWDVRRGKTSIKTVNAHSHWVSSVKYNPNHDQLVVSGGTDHAVKLWRLSSISSAPLLELEEESSAAAADSLVKRFDDHEDSVYSVAWSAHEAWVFGSVSHKGRVVISDVPSGEKYKILL